MNQPDVRSTVVALDITSLSALTATLATDPNHALGVRAQKCINTLIHSKGTLYKTARGRKGIQLPPSIFAKLKLQLRLETSEGYDGTLQVDLQPEPAPRAQAAAPVESAQ